MRPVPADGQTVRSGWVGRLRLLRQPLAVLLGAAPASDHHRVGTAGLVRVGQPEDSTNETSPATCSNPNLDLLARRAGQTLIADKGYASAEFETFLDDHDITLLRPAYKNRTPRPGARLLKSFRQIIESVNDTLKGQLDLERHGGRTHTGVATRVLQRLLALTAAIWHNEHSRPTRPAIPHRLRPLTPLGIDHLGRAGTGPADEALPAPAV